jgi:hypothetical protein
MSPRPSLRRALAPALAFAAALVAPGAASAAAPVEQFTPVTASVVAPPQPVEASDGRRHLAYELLLINRSFNPPARATLRGLQVRAGGGGRCGG